jgi:hypothetical protein
LPIKQELQNRKKSLFTIQLDLPFIVPDLVYEVQVICFGDDPLKKQKKKMGS